MIAPRLLKEIERIALLRLGEKHIIGVRDHVENVDRDRHRQKQEQGAPKILEPRLDLPRHGQHNGIHRQKNMYRKGMPMHKVGEGQLRPRGKQKRQKRRGNADAVQKIVQKLGRTPRVDGDEKNVDAAQMQRQIVLGIKPHRGQDRDL